MIPWFRRFGRRTHVLPISVYVLVLLGGFVFVTKWRITRYYTLRSDGYRLVFAALIAGVIFLFLSTIMIWASSLWLPRELARFRILWHDIVPATNSGKAATAFLLGCTAWWPLNLLGKVFPYFTDSAAADRAISRKQDPLEMFLRRALGDGSLISVSTKSGKVYVGKLRVTFSPAFPMDSISLWPLYSGHRDKDSQKLVLDFDYEAYYSKFSQELEAEWKRKIRQIVEETPKKQDLDQIYSELDKIFEDRPLQNRETIIPVAEIQSVNYFDMKIYEQYSKAKPVVARSA